MSTLSPPYDEAQLADSTGFAEAETASADPRIPEVIKHLRLLSEQLGRQLVVADYLAYRAKFAPRLPALTTVYRLFDSWHEALEAAGVESGGEAESTRTPDAKLIADLQEAARGLDVQALSSHAYDEYRELNPALDLSSSSVIRKWLDNWESAVTLAGLQTVGRAGTRTFTLAERVDAMRLAKSLTDGPLDVRAYNDWHSALPQAAREETPGVSDILAEHPNWELALLAARVELPDELHPETLWTSEEARRINAAVERLLGHAASEVEYAAIQARATKPMPDWQVLQYLLAS